MPGTRANQKLPQDVRVATRFFPVSEALRPYCSIIYHIEVDAPAGVRIEDYLHPEWANLRANAFGQFLQTATQYFVVVASQGVTRYEP